MCDKTVKKGKGTFNFKIIMQGRLEVGGDIFRKEQRTSKVLEKFFFINLVVNTMVFFHHYIV